MKYRANTGGKKQVKIQGKTTGINNRVPMSLFKTMNKITMFGCP